MPAFAVSDANDENMTFAFVGDVMMGRTFPSTQLPPQDGAQLFTDAKPILKRVDMALGNLEGALCEGGTSTKRARSARAERAPRELVPTAMPSARLPVMPSGSRMPASIS